MSIPADQLTKTPIFHITAIENLPNILAHGCLYATNNKPCAHNSIANEEIQARRAQKIVDLPPHGVLHDYVPFYFAPRSPMLYANHKGNLANARPQSDIAYLVTYAQTIAAAIKPFVFYDRHAVVATATPYNSLADLDKIDWDLFFEPPLLGRYSKYWQSKRDGANLKWIERPEIRQAEFLVHHSVDWHLIKGIATINDAKAAEVRIILGNAGIDTPVVTKPEWYY